MKTRVGLVPYLNARPFYQPLLEMNCPDLTLLFDLPSQLSRSLAEGMLQAALCPAIQASYKDYEMLPRHGIIARGPVGSVHLYSSKDPKDWETVYRDPSSINSAALVEVLCHRHFKNQARFIQTRQDLADAYLLIGDADLQHQSSQMRSWDLGEEWMKLTGLPFLFAAWVTRPTVPQEVKNILNNTFLDPHENDLSAVLSEDEKRLGIPAQRLQSYLQKNIYYKIDDEVLEGFQTFLSYLAEIRDRKNNQFCLAAL